MTRSEIMHEISGTIDMIREACRYSDDIGDAQYVERSVECWLDQLRSEIEQYEDAEDDGEEEE